MNRGPLVRANRTRAILIATVAALTLTRLLTVDSHIVSDLSRAVFSSRPHR